MSVDIAWFPDYGHIVVGIFVVSVALVILRGNSSGFPKVN